MIERLVIAGVLIAIAVVAALVMQRRRPDAPTQSEFTIPAQLDRLDFVRPQAAWLVVAFTSATCESCADVKEKMAVLESADVATQDVEATRDKDLYDRYHVEAVPTLVIADADGVVRGSFVGPMTATDLWATLAELREPGSVPPGCDHGQPD